MAKSRAKKGKRTPGIDSRPQLYDDLLEVWNAFIDLNKSRTFGFVANPIQYAEIEAWLRLNGINEHEERLFFAGLIKKLDAVYIEHGMKDKENGKPKTGN